MRNKARGLLLLVLAALLAGVSASNTLAQGNVRVFDETKHLVSGEILSTYEGNPEAMLLYGYPITKEFTDKMGKRVQYFQKARFEYDPTAPVGKQVKLTDLGLLILQYSKLAPAGGFSTNTPACSPFSSQYGTFFVCDSFLAFFYKHGGLAQFGYPLTNYSKEGDLYVQYFEKARFEYRPGLYSDDYVKLTNIGQIQFDLSGNDPDLTRPEQLPRDYSPKIIRLHALAFVGRAVIQTPGAQSLYVVVLDQGSDPVANAAVKVSMQLPDGREQSYSLPATDADGISQMKFVVAAQSPNTISMIQVEVTYEGIKAAATTWFRSWW